MQLPCYVSYISCHKLLLCYESFFGRLLPLIGTMKGRITNDWLHTNEF